MDNTKVVPFSIAFKSKKPFHSPMLLDQKTKKVSGLDFKLPEKYELLEEFFNGLASSIRLLRLKGSVATFTNISLQVECLTDRYDERTSCMKPDLLVGLNLEAFEEVNKAESHSKYLYLRKRFHDRLLDFFNSHP